MLEDGRGNWTLCTRYRAQEGGGEEQEPPDPGEAEEADWEDIQPGEEDREAGSDTAGGGRTNSTRRGQRKHQAKVPTKGRGGQAERLEGSSSRSSEPGTPDTEGDTSQLCQPN